MRNEALENAGYSSFFVHAYASFMIASEMTMQNISAFINRLFDFICVSENDPANYRDNCKFESIVQYTCNYEAMRCIKQQIIICLDSINLLNQELGRRKQKKHSVHAKIDLPTLNRDINPDDHAYDILKDVMFTYCTEKYRCIYGNNNCDTDNTDAEESITKDADDQIDYARTIAELLVNTHYAIRIIESAYDIPF